MPTANKTSFTYMRSCSGRPNLRSEGLAALELLSIKEAAQFMGVSPTRIGQYAEKSKLHTVRKNGLIHYYAEELRCLQRDMKKSKAQFGVTRYWTTGWPITRCRVTKDK